MLGAKTIHRANAITVIAAVSLALAGSIACWRVADRISKAEDAGWTARAHAETGRLSNHLISNIYKTEVNLRAISEHFRAAAEMSAREFDALIAKAKTWDPDVHFASVAYAERLTSAQRRTQEQEGAAPLAAFGSPEDTAPDRREHFAVRRVSPPNELIRIGTDLATQPALIATIDMARRLPGEAVLGPSFSAEGGERFLPIVIAADRGRIQGVIIAVMKAKPFILSIKEFATSPGIGLRVVEHDSQSGTNAIRSAIVGDMTAPENSELRVIRISRGLAHWALNWDITRQFQGGPDKQVEQIVRYGGGFLAIILPIILGYLVIQSLRFQHQVKERTAELSRSAMIIQLTMDTIDQGFAVWNSDHCLVVWSKRCLDFWYHPGDWLRPGMHMRELLLHLTDKGVFGDDDPETVLERELKRIVKAGADSEERFQLIDGRRVHVRRFPLEHGGHVAVYTDTSAQENALAELAHARDEMEEAVRQRTQEIIVARDRAEQANQAKTRLLANVSHELRTPLNAIIGFAEMIRHGMTESDNTASTDEYAQYIKRAGEDLLSVVSDLLEITRIEAGAAELDTKEIDVKELVENVLLIAGKAARPSRRCIVTFPKTFPI